MFGYVPDSFADIPDLYVPGGLSLTLWWISVGLHFMITIFFVMKARKIEGMPSVRALTNAYGFFFSAFALNRVFFILSYTTAYYEITVTLGYVFASSALVPIIFTFEKYVVQKTKFIFTGISVVIMALCIVSVFLPNELVTLRYTAQSLALLPGGMWVILYMWLIKLSTGAPRKKATLTLCSIVIFILGYFFDSELIYATRLFPTWVAPSLYILGTLIMAWIQFKAE